MIRRLVLCAACLAFPFAALAEPKEDAVAVFEEFLTALTAADADRVLSLFAPDALVWGTGMRDLATTPQAVRQYFSADGAADLNQFKASTFGTLSALVLSEDTVLVSGMWQLEAIVDGRPAISGPLRISLAVVRRGDRWLIAQFHNSTRPTAP